MLLLLLPLMATTTFALDCATINSCESCAGQHQGFLTCNWCMTSSSCVSSGICDHNNTIEVAYDCPRDPPKGFEYNETFARTRLYPLAAFAYMADQDACLKNFTAHYGIQVNMTKKVRKICDKFNDTCFGYAGVIEAEKAIFIVGRGSTIEQMLPEIIDTFDNLIDMPGGGKVHEYFYNAFDTLWNGGLGDELLRLKLQYPDFELWVTGHSLGAAIASLFAEMAVYKELWPGERIKLMTFGQPRTGDVAYSTNHDAKLPYSYRVIHAGDIITHVPPKMGDDPLFHHRYAVWYNNNMKVGQPYVICARPDDDSCANLDNLLLFSDHTGYFNYTSGLCCHSGCGPR